MTFIVTFIALLIERFFDWTHLREWRWFAAYQTFMAQKISRYSSYFSLAMTILPLLIAAMLVRFAIKGVLYGFISLLFELVVLVYCLGPQNLWADAFSCISAITRGDNHTVADKLKTSFGITDITYSQSLHRHLFNDIFIAANRRVFAVIFWYVILGPIGALLYRSVTQASQDGVKPEMNLQIAQSARMVESILDWLPVRVFTFLFALGGHFVQVLSFWRTKVMNGIESNEILLTECGARALGEDTEKLPENGLAEREAVSLLDRAFVILLVLIAIVVLIF